MQSYQELIEENYLFDTPKANWEYLEKLKEDATQAYALKSKIETFLKGIEGTPDDTTLGTIRSIIEISLKIR